MDGWIDTYIVCKCEIEAGDVGEMKWVNAYMECSVENRQDFF